LFTDPKLNFHAFPVNFYLYKDGLFVRSAKAEYAEVVGAKLLKVGKVPAEDAYKTVSDIVPRDNEMGVKEGAPHLLSMPEILNGLGLTDSTESVQYTFEANGKQIVVNVKAVPVSEIIDHLRTGSGKWVDAHDAAKAPTPLWLKDPRNNYWFEYLADSKTVYVKYNAVQNKDDESIADFFKRVFAFGESNPVDRLVIDMRNNDGGNNVLNWPIIYGLIRSDKLNQRGKLFVIIGRQTFSAAQNGVNQLERHTNAIFVGEPSGARPNSYGDPRRFVLPNSGITVRASTLWWQDLDPRDVRVWTPPAIAVEMSSTDYGNNVDPAMNAILNYVAEPPLADSLLDALKNNDLPLAIKRYREFKSNPTHVYLNTEVQMNRLGYDLLNVNKTEFAIEVFKLNVESYPDSFNVYDSLGEAYMKQGNKELAIKNYEKTLVLNPVNPGARDALRILRQ
jgi:tetratricopeptide (TPR) repeat protein